MVDQYGADTARLYSLFLGPPDQDAEWQDGGVAGAHRFLARLWRLVNESVERYGPGMPGVGARRRAGAPRWCARRTGRSTRSPSDVGERFAFNTAAVGPARAGRRDPGRRRSAPPPSSCGSPARRRCQPDPAVRAAHRLRAVGADGRRAAVGRAVAAGRSGDAGVRRGRLRGAGQRQAARRGRGAGRRCARPTVLAAARGRAQRGRAPGRQGRWPRRSSFPAGWSTWSSARELVLPGVEDVRPGHADDDRQQPVGDADRAGLLVRADDVVEPAVDERATRRRRRRAPRAAIPCSRRYWSRRSGHHLAS